MPVDNLFVVGVRSEGTPPDWEERAQALDIRHSWIVEAPAGSGKTGLLIQRYLKLLASEGVDEPEQVLAITFTVKATQEMRERVLAQLEGAQSGAAVSTEFDRETRTLAEAVLQRDVLRGWGLLDHPRRLNFRTIDSVCGEIARLLPVLSGGGGGLAPVEDATPMYREAARLTLMQLGGSDADLNEALRTVFLHRDGSLADCERLLMEMLPLRNQWGELVPLLGRELDDAYLDGTVLPRLNVRWSKRSVLDWPSFRAACRPTFFGICRCWPVRWDTPMDTRETLRQSPFWQACKMRRKRSRTILSAGGL